MARGRSRVCRCTGQPAGRDRAEQCCDLHAHGPGSNAACRWPSNADRMPQAQVCLRLLHCTDGVTRESLTNAWPLPVFVGASRVVQSSGKNIVLGRACELQHDPHSFWKLLARSFQLCAATVPARRARRALQARSCASRGFSRNLSSRDTGVSVPVW